MPISLMKLYSAVRISKLWVYSALYHIEVDCHFIRDKILSGDVTTPFGKSKDQFADIFIEA